MENLSLEDLQDYRNDAALSFVSHLKHWPSFLFLKMGAQWSCEQSVGELCSCTWVKCHFQHLPDLELPIGCQIQIFVVVMHGLDDINMFSIFTTTSNFLNTVRLGLWWAENSCSLVIRSLRFRLPFIALLYRWLIVGSSPQKIKYALILFSVFLPEASPVFFFRSNVS